MREGQAAVDSVGGWLALTLCSHDGVMGVERGGPWHLCPWLESPQCSVYVGTKLPDLRQWKSGGKTGLAPWGWVCRMRAALPSHCCRGSLPVPALLLR